MSQEEKQIQWIEKKEKISDAIIKLLDGLNNYQAKQIIDYSLSKVQSVSIINSKHL